MADSDALPMGSTDCAYLLPQLTMMGGREICGAKAVWHGLWSRNEDGTSPLDGVLGSATPLCPTHTLELIGRALIVDWHRFGGSCCMPGAVWHFALDDDDTSRCVWVDENGLEVVAFAELEQELAAEQPLHADTPVGSHP